MHFWTNCEKNPYSWVETMWEVRARSRKLHLYYYTHFQDREIVSNHLLKPLYSFNYNVRNIYRPLSIINVLFTSSVVPYFTCPIQYETLLLFLRLNRSKGFFNIQVSRRKLNYMFVINSNTKGVLCIRSEVSACIFLHGLSRWWVQT